MTLQIMIFPVLFPLVKGEVKESAIVSEITKFGHHHKVRTAAIVVALVATLLLQFFFYIQTD